MITVAQIIAASNPPLRRIMDAVKSAWQSSLQHSAALYAFVHGHWSATCEIQPRGTSRAVHGSQNTHPCPPSGSFVSTYHTSTLITFETWDRKQSLMWCLTSESIGRQYFANGRNLLQMHARREQLPFYTTETTPRLNSEPHIEARRSAYLQPVI